jgi:lipopolysaccharide/colanic/teichoic acid biosynthesis glycosyltransferase
LTTKRFPVRPSGSGRAATDKQVATSPANGRSDGPIQRPTVSGTERRSRAAERLARATKRAIDISGSAFGLVILSPLFAATATVIALTDGRPVLFVQSRAGLDGKPFSIVKFRTMGRDADSLRDDLRSHNEVAGGASFKMTDDPRITRLGRLLRRTSIDELPQLVNVLRGEMSLVGPRPHPFDDVAGYQPWHRARFAMKPGVTGLWQVSGRDEDDFDRWVELDLEYIRDWSLALDLRILARTLPAVLRGTGR